VVKSIYEPEEVYLRITRDFSPIANLSGIVETAAFSLDGNVLYVEYVTGDNYKLVTERIKIEQLQYEQ
jgi:hypothetical protein